MCTFRLRSVAFRKFHPRFHGVLVDHNVENIAGLIVDGQQPAVVRDRFGQLHATAVRGDVGSELLTGIVPRDDRGLFRRIVGQVTLVEKAHPRVGLVGAHGLLVQVADDGDPVLDAAVGHRHWIGQRVLAVRLRPRIVFGFGHGRAGCNVARYDRQEKMHELKKIKKKCVYRNND